MDDIQFKTFNDYIGELKAVYRRTELPTQRISSSKSVYEFIYSYYDERMDDREELRVIHLNRANKVVNVHDVTIGSDAGTIVPIKDIMRYAILLKTNAIILCHNHPSGTLKPSQADISSTKKLKEAADLFEISLLDHLIVSREGYYSFADEGLI